MALVTLTREHIEQLRTPQGGYNQATMELLGAWPLVEGWQQRLVGKKIGERRLKAAMKARLRKRHVFRGNTRRPHRYSSVGG